MNVYAPLKVTVPFMGELTFATVISAISSDAALPQAKKRHWITSLRQMAQYLGLPLESLPGRISAISGVVAKLHPERLGVNAKTFANHRSCAKAALQWFNHQSHGSARSAPMDPCFRALWDQIPSRHAKDMLSPFFRFLTSLELMPSAVTDSHVGDYARHRRQTSFKDFPVHRERQLIRYWNESRLTVPAWPDITMCEPAYAKGHDGPAFEEFPVGLKEGIKSYRTHLGKPHRTKDGRLMKPCARSTIDLAERILVAAARMAVKAGIPLANLATLEELVSAQNAETIIEAYWRQDGERPSLSTIDLPAKFINVARSIAEYPPADLVRLEDIRHTLEQYRTAGLTPKNRAVVRDVLQSNLWAKVVNLPSRLMAEADARRKESPMASAVLAQVAIAIRILTVAPVRMKNLTEVEIGTHLVRPGGPGAPYYLTFEAYDVKNNIALDFDLDTLTSELIERYIYNHRPHLMHGQDHNCLFPSTGQRSKASDTFGLQITARLQKRLGIHLTPHQFRHCAAALLLEHHPGNFELVKQVLGHKNLATTMAFYVGLETIGATRAFAAIVTGMDAPAPTASATVRRNWRHV